MSRPSDPTDIEARLQEMMTLAILQDEALARDGVSREVPCSALKLAPLHLGPFSPPDRDRRVDSPVLS